jgi:hypothetical protein
MAAINVLLSFEKVKDLINSLPQETFKQGTELANKKKMADAAIRQIEVFFDKMNKGQNHK